MSKKRYTTKYQRELLESAGLPHRSGRTYDEASSLIQQLIESGDLPQNALSPPTEKQLDFLKRNGISIDDSVTKEKASELISTKIEESNQRIPISTKQHDYIIALGGIPTRSMTRTEAGRFIDYLLEHSSNCTKCGSLDDRRSKQCPSCGAFLPHRSPIRPPRSILASDVQKSNRLRARTRPPSEEQGIVAKFMRLFGL